MLAILTFLGLAPMVAHAASDPNIIGAATSTAESLSDNSVDGVVAVLPYAAGFIALLILINLVIRLFRRGRV